MSAETQPNLARNRLQQGLEQGDPCARRIEDGQVSFGVGHAWLGSRLAFPLGFLTKPRAPGCNEILR